jgi:hypothetical protein
MTTSRILPCILVLTLAVGAGVGCQGKGEGDQTVDKTELVQLLSDITQSYGALQQARQGLEALRSEMAELEATPDASRSPEQQARLDQLRATWPPETPATPPAMTTSRPSWPTS